MTLCLEYGLYYDRDGNPLTLYEWIALRETPGYQLILNTRLGPERMVSTVWLGTNLGIGPDLRIFESAYFVGWTEGSCGKLQSSIRSSTEAEAIAAHFELVNEFASEGETIQ